MRILKRLPTGADDAVTRAHEPGGGGVREHMSDHERLRLVGHQLRAHAGDAEVVVPARHLGIGAGPRALLPGVTAVVVVDLRRGERGAGEHREDGKPVRDERECPEVHGADRTRWTSAGLCHAAAKSMR